MTELAYLSAVEAAAAFRARTLSPVELLDAVIDRSTLTEPTINSLVWPRYDQAREEARAAEQRFLAGSPLGPLDGIPLAVKEEMAITGHRNTQASKTLRDHRAEHTHPVAERLINGGAVIHARTTQPEFACAGFTWSYLFGTTRNPWNTSFDVGGSSGGAGAALASGVTTLANGSDIGGSIRIPASCCGIVGHKPSYGTWPQEPPFTLDLYSHEGPMARSVADCALFHDAVSGVHPGDLASLRDPQTVSNAGSDIRGWKVALSLDLDGWEVDPDVRANTLAVAAALRDAGAEVEEVRIGWSREEIITAAGIHFAAIFGSYIAAVAAEHADEMTPYALKFAELTSIYAEPGALLRGIELEGGVALSLGTLLQDYRILLCPTLAIPALPAGEPGMGDPRANGYIASALPAADHLMTIPFNICSRNPVMSIPSGFSRDGVPTGAQIVGRTFTDRDVYTAASAIEQRLPFMDAPQRRPRL